MRSAFERMEFESFRIANGAIKLTTPTFQEKNEVFVPEGFQRAMRQTGAVNARKALWWGDGAKPHIHKCLDSCFLKYLVNLDSPFFFLQRYILS